jgi:hypothetical protein
MKPVDSSAIIGKLSAQRVYIRVRQLGLPGAGSFAVRGTAVPWLSMLLTSLAEATSLLRISSSSASGKPANGKHMD